MISKKSKAGGVLLISENNNIYILLVLGRAANKWGIPKGSIEHNESLEDAANREVFEETGININNYNTMKILNHNKSAYKLIKLPGSINDYKLCTNDPIEIKSVKWFSIKELFNIDEKKSNATIKFLYRRTPWIHVFKN